jgi:hypothetical protein
LRFGGRCGTGGNLLNETVFHQFRNALFAESDGGVFLKQNTGGMLAVDEKKECA